MNHSLLDRLRELDLAEKIGPLAKSADSALLAEWQRSEAPFVSSADRPTDRYCDAVRELFDCIASAADDTPILHSGAIFHNFWLDSTGTIKTEISKRFLPLDGDGGLFGFFAISARPRTFPLEAIWETLERVE